MICLTFCVACGHSNHEHLHHHHLVPRIHGGSDDEINLITLCTACHGKVHGVKWHNNHRTLIVEGMERAKTNGKVIGRSRIAEKIRNAIRTTYLNGGVSMRAVAEQFGVGVATVKRCIA